MTAPSTAPAMTLDELNAHFGIDGVLRFDHQPGTGSGEGLVVAVVTTPACSAELYLQGAHLALWQPEGGAPGLFLSARTKLEPGVAIRGGIPVIFPWFGPRSEDLLGNAPVAAQGEQKSGSHGFARTSLWTVAFAALIGDELRLTLTLEPTAESRALGYDDFQCALEFTLGRTLRVQFAVANRSAEPLVFEEALHTYLHVGEVSQAVLTGLENTEYLDKRDNAARKRQSDVPMHFTKTLDEVYLDTQATCTVTDPVLGRKLIVAKTGSDATVVWNPWTELTAGLADMEPEGWRTMLCVETANTGPNRLTLAPGAIHTMELRLAVEPA